MQPGDRGELEGDAERRDGGPETGDPTTDAPDDPSATEPEPAGAATSYRGP